MSDNEQNPAGDDQGGGDELDRLAKKYAKPGAPTEQRSHDNSVGDIDLRDGTSSSSSSSSSSTSTGEGDELDKLAAKYATKPTKTPQLDLAQQPNPFAGGPSQGAVTAADQFAHTHAGRAPAQVSTEPADAGKREAHVAVGRPLHGVEAISKALAASPEGAVDLDRIVGSPDLATRISSRLAIGSAPAGYESQPVAEGSIEDALVKSLHEDLKPAPAQPTSLLGRTAAIAGDMALHPVNTAVGIATALPAAAATLGKYTAQLERQRRGAAPGGPEISDRDAAFAAGQLLASGATELALPVLDSWFGSTMAKSVEKAVLNGESPTKALAAGYAAHVAAHAGAGAAIGGVFAPGDPAAGALIGAVIGGAHSATETPHVETNRSQSLSNIPDQLLGAGKDATPSTARVAPEGVAAPDTESPFSVEANTPAEAFAERARQLRQEQAQHAIDAQAQTPAVRHASEAAHPSQAPAIQPDELDALAKKYGATEAATPAETKTAQAVGGAPAASDTGSPLDRLSKAVDAAIAAVKPQTGDAAGETAAAPAVPAAAANGNAPATAPEAEKKGLLENIADAVKKGREGIADAVAPHLKEQRETLEKEKRDLDRKAHTDPLTGLANARAWDKALPLAEKDPRTAIIRLDVNGFKTVNDVLGHEAGDRVLKEIAAKVRANTPGIAARPGGDEMGALAPAKDAQRIRDAIEKAVGVVELRGPNGEIVKYSISGGVGATNAEADAAAIARKAVHKKAQGIASRGEVTPAEKAPSTAADVRMEPLENLDVEPERFQYKLNTNERGVTNALEGVKWNPDLAGVVSVWRDPVDGRLKVVNGHHRYELAKENGVSHIAVREINSENAAEARSRGALINIADGKGTAVDAAKLFRDTTITPADMAAYGVNPKGAIARDGMALSELHPSLFARVVNGELPPARGAAIGGAGLTPEQQLALSGMLDARESKGKRLSTDAITELVRFVREAGSETTTQDSLFGEEHLAQSLAPEKAELSAYIKDRLAKDRRLMGFLTKGGRAERIEAAGVGKVNTETAGAIATRSAMMEEVYNKLSTMSGPVSDALTRAAREWVQGVNRNEIKDQLYTAVADAVRAEAGSAGAAVGRSEAPSTHGLPARREGAQTAVGSPRGSAADDRGIPGAVESSAPRKTVWNNPYAGVLSAATDEQLAELHHELQQRYDASHGKAENETLHRDLLDTRNEILGRDRAKAKAAEGAEPAALEDPDQEGFALGMRTGDETVGAGFDKSLFKKLGANMYKGDLGVIALKEGLQNAVDSVRGLATGDGKISIDYRSGVNYGESPRLPTLLMSDNGHGMSPDVMETAFVDVGGSAKNATDSSGGYGLAKVALFSRSKSIRARSVADVDGKLIETSIDGSGDDWAEGGMKFTTREVPAGTPTGTTLRLELEAGVDPSTHQMREWLQRAIEYSRLPVAIGGTLNAETVSARPVSMVEEPIDQWTVPGAHVKIFETTERRDQDKMSEWERDQLKVHVLNRGLYQFSTAAHVPGNGIPAALVVDVSPNVDVENPNYPFTTSREELKRAAGARLEDFLRDLKGHAHQREAISAADAFKRGGVRTPNGKYRVIDDSNKLGREVEQLVADAKWTEPLMTAIDDAWHNAWLDLSSDWPDMGEFEFFGFGVTRKWVGLNVSGVLLENLRVSSGLTAETPDANKLLFNPFTAAMEVSAKQDLRGAMEPDARAPERGDWVRRMAWKAWATGVHELAHQLERNHSEKFSGVLTRFIERSTEIAPDHINTLIAAFHNALLNGFAETDNEVNKRWLAGRANKKDVGAFDKFADDQAVDEGESAGARGGHPERSDDGSDRSRLVENSGRGTPGRGGSASGSGLRSGEAHGGRPGRDGTDVSFVESNDNGGVTDEGNSAADARRSNDRGGSDVAPGGGVAGRGPGATGAGALRPGAGEGSDARPVRGELSGADARPVSELSPAELFRRERERRGLAPIKPKAERPAARDQEPLDVSDEEDDEIPSPKQFSPEHLGRELANTKVVDEHGNPAVVYYATGSASDDPNLTRDRVDYTAPHMQRAPVRTGTPEQHGWTYEKAREAMLASGSWSEEQLAKLERSLAVRKHGTPKRAGLAALTQILEREKRREGGPHKYTFHPASWWARFDGLVTPPPGLDRPLGIRLHTYDSSIDVKNFRSARVYRHPVYANIKRPLRLRDGGPSAWTYEGVRQALIDSGYWTDEQIGEYERAAAKGQRHREAQFGVDALRELITRERRRRSDLDRFGGHVHGFDGIVFRDLDAAPGSAALQLQEDGALKQWISEGSHPNDRWHRAYLETRDHRRAFQEKHAVDTWVALDDSQILPARPLVEKTGSIPSPAESNRATRDRPSRAPLPAVREAETDLFGNPIESPKPSKHADQESMFGGNEGTAASRNLKQTERAAQAELEKLKAQEKAETSFPKKIAIAKRITELEKLVNRDKAITSDELSTRAKAGDNGAPKDLFGGAGDATAYGFADPVTAAVVTAAKALKNYRKNKLGVSPHPMPMPSAPRTRRLRIGDTLQKVRALFNPESLGVEAPLTAGNIRHVGALRWRRYAQAEHSVRDLEKHIDSLSRAKQIEAWDAYEKGKLTGDPTIDGSIKIFRGVTELRTQQLIALDRLRAEKAILNYIGRYWEQKNDPKSVATFLRSIYGKRPFEGPKSFLKQRSLDFFVDGLDAGLVPPTYNFVTSQLAKIQEMERLIGAEQLLRLERKNGRARGLMLGAEPPKDAEGNAWVRIDPDGKDPAFTIYGPPEVHVWEGVDAVIYGKLQHLIRQLNVLHDRKPRIGGSRLGYAMADKLIVTKFGGPEGVIMHELGHILDERYDLKDQIKTAIGSAPTRTIKKGKRAGQQAPDYSAKGGDSKDARDRREALREELRQLANLRREYVNAKGEGEVPDTDLLHPTDRKYLHSWPEKMANMVNAYIANPARFKKVAPGIFEIFDRFVGAHPELKSLRDMEPSLSHEGRGESLRLPGPTLIGHWYAPRASAAVWHNHLSKGLHGNPIYDALTAPGTAATQILLGISGFHATVIATEGMFSDLVLAAEHAMEGEGKASARAAVRTIGNPASTVVSSLSPSTSKAGTLAFGAKVMEEYRSPGTHPELARVLDAMIAGGFRGTAKSELWTGERTKALKRAIETAILGDKKLSQALAAAAIPMDTLWAGIELAAAPLMSKYVPLMKTAATYQAVAKRLAELPAGLSIDDLHRDMWDIVKEMDFRFGQVAYENYFINNFAKHLAQGLLLAPGWSIGTGILTGRGLRDVAVAPKRVFDRVRSHGERARGRKPAGAQYSGLPVYNHTTKSWEQPDDEAPQPILGRSGKYWVAAIVGTMLINGILTYLNSGTMPGSGDDGWKDFFAFRDGTFDIDANPNRHTIPGYLMHDVYGYATHPYKLFLNKLSPFFAFAARVIRNETYNGDLVRDPNASGAQQTKEVLHEAGKEFLPLSVQNYLEGRNRGETGPGEVGRNAFGVTPAKREFTRTKAQNEMAEYLARRGHTEMTPDEAESRDERQKVLSGLRGVTPDVASRITRALQHGELTSPQLNTLMKRAGMLPLAEKYKSLTAEQALKVFQDATPWERAVFSDLLEKKLDNADKKAAKNP